MSNDLDKNKKVPNVPNLRFDNSIWIASTIIKDSVFIKDGTHGSHMDVFNGIPLLSAKDIYDGKIHINSNCRKISLADYQSIHKKETPVENDILLTIVGTVGRTAIVPSNIQLFTFQRSVGWVRCNDGINPLFYSFLLNSKNVLKQMLNKVNASAQGGIYLGSLGVVNTYLPPIYMQNKIAEFLSLIEGRIETQNKIIEHYKSLINSIIDLKIYNSNNNRETLKTYVSLKNGYAFKSENYNKNGQYKIVTIGNVTGDQYISDNTNNIDKIPFDIQRHQILKKNDILVSLTGNVGRVSMVNSDNCLLNQRVGLIQINNIEFRNYIYVVLSSHIFEREMVNKSQGAAQLNIGKNDVENYKMPKPTKTNLEISELIFKYLTKLSIEKRILKLFQDEKKYLLSNLFI